VFHRFTEQTQDFSWPENAVAVLPLGAVETHGPHLPLGTDGLIADGILDRAAAMDGDTTVVARLPLLWLGASAEHADRAGTLSRAPEQVIADIVAIGEGLAHCGIKRVVLFNGHGGNIAAAGIAALKLRTRFGMLAASAHWLDFGLPAGLDAPTPPLGDVHGGWVETSVMLHLAPALVVTRAARGRDATPPAPSLFPQGPIAWGWKLDDLAPGSADGGWIGRPDLATPALGQALVDHAAGATLRLLQELSAAAWPS
jgi:creatinine amidohydrolase